MNKDKALDLALEALELSSVTVDSFGVQRKTQVAITAIKQARSAPVQSCYCPNCEAMSKELAALKAQPVQEPVAWAGHNLDDMCEAFDRVIEEHASRKNPFHDPVNKNAMIALRILRGFVPYMKRYTTPPAQPANKNDGGAVMLCGAVVTNVYDAYDAGKKAAAKRQWVGLTDEERDAIRFSIPTKAVTQRDFELARAIEGKLRSKNGY